MLRFDRRHKDFGAQPALDLFRVSTLQEQLDRLLQIGGRLFDGRPPSFASPLGAWWTKVHLPHQW